MSFKIAILGCENSHANRFLHLIAEGAYPDIQVTGIYSDQPEAALTLHQEFQVPVMEAPDQLCGQVDGIMITARHGDNHYRYAKPYLSYGIPMFIDKPITCHPEDALALIRDAAANGVRLCGGSTCASLSTTLELAQWARSGAPGTTVGGSITSPIYSDSPYGGFHFYAQHLIDIMLAIFGTDVDAVYARRESNAVCITVRYTDGRLVNGTYVEGGKRYHAAVYGTKAVKAEELTVTPDSFRSEMNAMQALLHGENMTKSYEHFILPVFITNAILHSLQSNQWESVLKIQP